ncbi:MAG: hypothetical protein OXB92_13800 [Acidimicrobiaceae bacterium]|nr:hypothetical protein [Acidimicrobiaceae bacterium]
MPWCAPCEKNWTPTSLTSAGTCPDCGEPVEPTPGVDHAPHVYRPPWHFWLGLIAATVYLAWRAIDGLLLLF